VRSRIGLRPKHWLKETNSSISADWAREYDVPAQKASTDVPPISAAMAGRATERVVASRAAARLVMMTAAKASQKRASLFVVTVPVGGEGDGPAVFAIWYV
jgi:hypothetical protein